MNYALVVMLVWGMNGSAESAQDQGSAQHDSSKLPGSRNYKLEELTWPQIDALDRQRTLFILPVGMLEEHVICPLARIPWA